MVQYGHVDSKKNIVCQFSMANKYLQCKRKHFASTVDGS